VLVQHWGWSRMHQATVNQPGSSVVKKAGKILDKPTDAMLTDWLNLVGLQAHRHAAKSVVL